MIVVSKLASVDFVERLVIFDGKTEDSAIDE